MPKRPRLRSAACMASQRHGATQRWRPG